GSSLIGGVIDYSIHFFADRFRNPEHWTPIDAVHHVGGAIVFGLITTLIGYVVLALVPFPGLTQIAFFCAVGLAAGCACVICWYPLFAKPGRKPPPTFGARIGAAIDRFMLQWRWTSVRVIALIVIGAVTLFGLTRIQIQDDIRSLVTPPQNLMDQEQKVRELLGTGFESRFFLVSGESEQTVLETERRLTEALDGLVARGALQSYQAISNAVPPLAYQEATHRLLAEHVYRAHGLLDRVLEKLGFPTEAIEKRRREFFSNDQPLRIDEWRQSPAADAFKHLWLGKVGERYASIVTLGGIKDVQALAALNVENGSHVRLIDTVASTSDMLKKYRRVMSWLLALIYVVAGIVLTVRFGWRDAPRMLLPSALATLITVSLFGWFNVPINLFILLGFWLVLGMGIDYGIFLRHGQEGQDPKARATAILSVTLSTCTTLLAFGPLTFSATPFIHSIGLTLLCAIMLSWLLVMFSCLTLKKL
ncbi:MAG TPA: MMPL family transporter, partial [Steroidobacteraceae bacterium]|nr:MMPL family transporter [Steroidobacteraceae bacterium]